MYSIPIVHYIFIDITMPLVWYCLKEINVSKNNIKIKAMRWPGGCLGTEILGCEDISLLPTSKLGLIVCTLNLNLKETEAGRSRKLAGLFL